MEDFVLKTTRMCQTFPLIVRPRQSPTSKGWKDSYKKIKYSRPVKEQTDHSTECQ